MSDPAGDIIRLNRSVLMRTRLLLLQDSFSVALIIGALIGAVLSAFISMRLIELNRWVIVPVVAIVSVVIVVLRWQIAKRNNPEPVFLIDSTFQLEDRVAASTAIIQRGGPRRPLEEALIQDTAERLKGKRPEEVVPFRIHIWYALPLASMFLLIAALMIPVRPLPGQEALASERADIEAAGESLERAAAEVERTIPPSSETAALAKEQGDIGRGFRGVKLTRAEALRRLSALEERLQKRHNLLAETRADEIVSLADRRLRSTLSEISTARSGSKTKNDSQAESLEAAALRAGENPNKDKASTSSTDQRKSIATGDSKSSDDSSNGRLREPRAATGNDAASGLKRSNSTEQPHSRGSNAKNNESESARVDSKGQTASKKSDDQRESPSRVPSLQSSSKGSEDKNEAADQKVNDQQQDQTDNAGSNPLNSMPTTLAAEAAKRLPALSSELLKKAAELRAKELTRQDVEKLRKAAESLSRELSQIGQSQELKKALEEMARQVRPEDIEKVARELGNQEEIRKELEAAGRLLNENQQAKETVAGIAGQLAERGENEQSRSEFAGDLAKQNKQAAGVPKSYQSAGQDRTRQPIFSRDARFAGQGKDSIVKGKLQQHSGGEYLYLQSRAGTSAARAPYSSAYPQYRREAERSVQRSQVPSNMRTVVRKYFDAINPDAKN